MRIGKTQKIVYDYLRQQIETGTWQDGFHIVEQDIADDLQVSRTPIRSAINQLIEKGYIEKTKNRGVLVKKTFIGDKEFLERTQLIELLCSHYLYQLQIKESLIDSLGFYELQQLQGKTTIEKEICYDKFWQLFLQPLQNELMKTSVLVHVNAIKFVRFPNVSVDYLFDETIVLSHKLSDLLKHQKYDLARKEIRLYINRLNLELIDQQI